MPPCPATPPPWRCTREMRNPPAAPHPTDSFLPRCRPRGSSRPDGSDRLPLGSILHVECCRPWACYLPCLSRLRRPCPRWRLCPARLLHRPSSAVCPSSRRRPPGSRPSAGEPQPSAAASSWPCRHARLPPLRRHIRRPDVGRWRAPPYGLRLARTPPSDRDGTAP